MVIFQTIGVSHHLVGWLNSCQTCLHLISALVMIVLHKWVRKSRCIWNSVQINQKGAHTCSWVTVRILVKQTWWQSIIHLIYSQMYEVKHTLYIHQLYVRVLYDFNRIVNCFHCLLLNELYGFNDFGWLYCCFSTGQLKEGTHSSELLKSSCSMITDWPLESSAVLETSKGHDDIVFYGVIYY